MKKHFLLALVVSAAMISAGTAAYADSISFSQSTVTMSVGNTNTVTLSGADGFHLTPIRGSQLTRLTVTR